MVQPGDLTRIILQWQELHQQLESVSPEDLCRDRPDLLPEVKRRIEALRQAQVSLTSNQPSTFDRTAPEKQEARLETTDDMLRMARQSPPQLIQEIAGYQILEVLGRGGMGVVYKARQPGLNRLVALKMILHADHAAEQDRERFLREAEAIARLQHPNIVQIHEIGSHEGKPFFSLELVEEGSLEGRLDGAPLPALEAAELLEVLARAVDVAHQHNIIHRDLKPANVLMAKDGVPKITDFGLAKKLDEAGHTATGAVMGTPSYMAPEQASGRASDLGPGADVYALGAILYECLTGRPPFHADNVMDTLLQVVGEEPVPPSRLQPKLPRDLETICLKCLQKDPQKRYSSAEGMAEDLRRFRNGQPVEARPVGSWERFTKWAARNPLVALLTAAVVLVLIAGTTVSSVLAFKASSAEGDAKLQAEEAKQKEQEARDAAKQLEKSNDELLTNAARNLSRIIGLGMSPSTPTAPFRDPELRSLNDLSGTSEEKLRKRFIEVALDDLEITSQLGYRGEAALLATVGLNSQRRKSIERIFYEKLGQKELTEEHRINIALLATRLDRLSPPMATRAAQVLSQAIVRTTEPDLLQRLSDGLSVTAASMPSSELVDVVLALVQAMSQTRDGSSLRAMAQNIARVAPRLESPEASRAATLIAQQLKEETDIESLRYLAESLASVAFRMERDEATQLCAAAVDKLTRVMTVDKGQSRYFTSLSKLAPGLTSLAASIGPEETARAAITFALLMNKLSNTVYSEVVRALASQLSTSAPRIESRTAAQVADILIRALGTRHTDGSGSGMLTELFNGFASISARLSPSDAARTANTLIRAISSWIPGSRFQSSRTSQLSAYYRCWNYLLPRMDSDGIAQAVSALTRAIGKVTHPSSLEHLSKGLSLFAAHVEPEEAAKFCSDAATVVLESISKMPSRPTAGRQSFQALSVLSTHLKPEEAVTVLTQAMAKTTNSSIISDLEVRICDFATRMEPKAAIAALNQTISNSNNAFIQRRLLERFASVIPRLDPQDAIRLLNQLFDKHEPLALSGLLEKLPDALADMEPKVAMNILLRAMEIMTRSNFSLSRLSWGISRLAARLDPEEAAMACSKAAENLLRIMKKPNNSAGLSALTFSLAQLAPYMKPEEATQACSKLASLLTRALSKPDPQFQLSTVVLGLAYVCPYLSREEGIRARLQIVDTFIQSKSKETLPPRTIGRTRSTFTELVPIAPHMESGEAARAAASLVAAMRQVTSPHALRSLSLGLAAVAARMAPEDAVHACSETITLVNQAMRKSRTTNPSARSGLTISLAAVAPHMDTETASAILIHAIEKTTNTYTLVSLTENLSAVLLRMTPERMASVSYQAMAALARTMSKMANRKELESLSPRFSSLVNATRAEGTVQALHTAFSNILHNVSEAERARRKLSPLASGFLLAQPSRWSTVCARLQYDAIPFPCRLRAKELVDLLKLPTCYGLLRRTILDQLEILYRQSFSSHWDFVSYATQQKLSLGLETPSPENEPQPGELNLSQPKDMDLLAMLGNRNSYYQQMLAVELMVQQGAAALGGVKTALKHQSPLVRENALKVLLRIAPKKQPEIPILIQMAIKPEGEGERAALELLAQQPGATLQHEWLSLLVCQLHAGKLDQYRKTCAKLIDRYQDAKDDSEMQWLVACLTIGPCDPKDARRLIPVLEQRVQEKRSSATLLLLGRALYRAGDHQRAIAVLEESIQAQEKGSNPTTWLYLSMAYDAVGRRQDFYRCFARYQPWYLSIREGSASWELKLAWKWRDSEATARVQTVTRQQEALKAARCEHNADWSGAENHLTILLHDQFWRADLHVRKAYALQRQKKNAMALQHYLIASRLDPSMSLWPINSSARQWGIQAATTRKAKQAETELLLAAHQPGSTIWGDWYPLLLTQLRLRNLPGYQATCAEMTSLFENSTDPGILKELLLTCTTGPCSKEVAERLVIAGKRLVAQKSDAVNLLRLGSAQYRAEQYQDAIKTLEQSNKVHGRGGYLVTEAYLVMAYKKTGRAQEAQRGLSRVRAYHFRNRSNFESLQNQLQWEWWYQEVILGRTGR